MFWKKAAVPLAAFGISITWFSVVFSQFPSEVAIRADATIKLEKAVQWNERGSFFYQYPQSEQDPEERGIAHHLSGAMPHLASYQGERVITYPETFAILVGLWYRYLPPASLAWISVLFFLIELGVFLWIARSALHLNELLCFFGSMLLLFCTPHFIFSLQLQEVVMASSLFLLSVALLLSRESAKSATVAGLLAGIAFSVRQEVVISALVLCILILFRNEGELLRSQRGKYLATVLESHARDFFVRNSRMLIFGLAFLSAFIFYLVYNWLLYGEPLGSRYHAVQDEPGGLAWRWHIFKSILVGHFDPSRPVLGMLAQMPFLLLLATLPFYYRSLGPIARLLALLGIISALGVALLSPNDSWGGWGQRFTMIIHGPLILGFLGLIQVVISQQGHRIRKIAIMTVLTGLIVFSFFLARFGWKLEKQTMGYSTEIQGDLMAIQEMPGLQDTPVISTTDIYYWAGLQYFKQTLYQLRTQAEVRADMEYFLRQASLKGSGTLIIADSDMYREDERSRYQALLDYLKEHPEISMEPLTKINQGSERFYLITDPLLRIDNRSIRN